MNIIETMVLMAVVVRERVDIENATGSRKHLVVAIILSTYTYAANNYKEQSAN